MSATGHKLATTVPRFASGTPEQQVCGAIQRRDQEVVEHWRQASADAHATAMIELSRYAVRTAEQTGLGKKAGEMFPGFAQLALRPRPAGLGSIGR